MKKLPLALGASALALSLVLTGCTAETPSAGGDTAPSTSASSATANSGDELFVTMMIPHHQQAIAMADIALAKDGLDPRVAELAQQVKDAQGPEIERMLGWLEDWGVEYNPDPMGGMDHGSMSPDGGDGMMSEDDMTALENADATEASRLFLEQMIMHHEGAVDMARTALEDAQNPEVLALAQQVIEDQTVEIATMQDLLAEL